MTTLPLARPGRETPQAYAAMDAREALKVMIKP